MPSVAAATASGHACAQESYPSKPIQLVVTTAAGGALDLIARTTAERLAESMRQPVVIEIREAVRQEVFDLGSARGGE